MATRASTSLRRLEAELRRYGPGRSERKRSLLRPLAHARLTTADQVSRLHECLCFLRAYPDDRDLLRQVEKLLERFERRADLRRHREALADSGIAGTPIRYRLFWPLARWAVAHWPEAIELEWDDDEASERLGAALPGLVTRAEAECLLRKRGPARSTLDHLRGEVTDATFVVRRIARLPGDDFTREALHDSIDMEYRLSPSDDGPSRTRARFASSPVVFCKEPPSRVRPDLRVQLKDRPHRIRPCSSRDGRRLIDMAREAMITRSRDLEAFGYGNPDDVWLVDEPDGLQFACIGVVPERRAFLHAIYGYLTLKNGVPIGYVQVDGLLRDAAVSYNTFDTYRGGEAARVFGRMLAATHSLLGSRTFSIEPYQLGAGNEEGLETGAWWFYYKLGFRPRDPAVRRVLRRELARMKRNPRHRSDRKTLERLASAHLFFEESALPPPPWDLGLTLGRRLGERAGADRELATEESAREAAKLVGVRSRRSWSVDENRAFERLGPLVLELGVERWTAAERARLVEVIRAKGGRHERDFVMCFDGHPRLCRALRQMVRPLA